MSAPRRAVTLLELLVVIVLVALLIAILLPATMRVRESSRRAQCSNKLRQIGIAVHAYESDHGIFPPGASPGGYSVHVAILPYVEHAALYNQVNFSVLGSFTHGDTDEGLTLRMTTLGLYVCPSDPLGATPWDKVGYPSNYAGNAGTGTMSKGWNGFFQYLGNDSQFRSGPLRARDFTDGLGNTAAVGEILVSDLTPTPLRAIWDVQPRQSTLDQLAADCMRHARTGFYDTFRGRPWTHGDIGRTRYNHVLTPNQNSCMNHGAVQLGVYTAASLHGGGVNVLFGDDAVRFLSDSVDVSIWQAIGSRNGGETVGRNF